ncbi:MAG: arsenate reductase ArsC [Mesorhizobium sp.]
MTARPYNVLFLCTGNSARSILAESILRKEGGGRFNAYSAGSYPKGAVNPFALKVLENYGYPTDGLRSKSWDEFTGAGTSSMDFIFTVCDDAAGEQCPVWPGHPATAHWGIDDPSNVQGTDIEKEAAFVTAFKYMKNRISLFLALPLDTLDRLSLSSRLAEIGKTDGASIAAAR